MRYTVPRGLIVRNGREVMWAVFKNDFGLGVVWRTQTAVHVRQSQNYQGTCQAGKESDKCFVPVHGEVGGKQSGGGGAWGDVLLFFVIGSMRNAPTLLAVGGVKVGTMKAELLAKQMAKFM